MAKRLFNSTQIYLALFSLYGSALLIFILSYLIKYKLFDHKRERITRKHGDEGGNERSKFKNAELQQKVIPTF